MRITLIQTTIMLTLCGVAIASNNYGQSLLDQKVTAKYEQATLKHILTDLEQKTTVRFIYSASFVDLEDSISIAADNLSLRDLLNGILTSRKIAFQEKEDFIVLTQQPDETGEPMMIAPQPEFHTVAGTVRDKNGEPMAAVNVAVKGRLNGTATDVSGRYSIIADPLDVLVFSFIGHKTREELTGPRTIIDVVLEEDAATLQEVEIIGTTYSNTTKAMSTSSIVKITAKEIERQPVTNPLLALQGRVPGLEITPATGGPSANPRIQIRGTNSLNGINGSRPLFIIDGIYIESSGVLTSVSIFNGTKDPLSGINPANIESMEVLKDADATAVYGSRGANGVIIIKTKQAKANNASFDLATYRGVGHVANKVRLMKTRQYLDMRHQAFENDGIAPNFINAPDLLLWDTTRYTDWQDELLGGTANITDVQGNFNAGNHSTSFRLGGGYHKETLIVPGDFYYQRANGNLGINHLSTDGKMRLVLNLNYGYEKNKLSGSSLVQSALTLPPNAPSLYDQNGDLNWVPRPDGVSSFRNPLARLKNQSKASYYTLIANTVLTYQLRPDIMLKTNLGFTNGYFNEVVIAPISAFNPESRSSAEGRAFFKNGKRNSWMIEPQLSYDKEVSGHTIRILLGSTLQNTVNNATNIEASGYTSDALLESLGGAGSYRTDEYISNYKYLSFFVRAQYDYKEKYLFSISARRDGSSRFGPDNRFGNFYSVATGWVFSNESFVKDNLKFLSFGKFRGSYGVTGSDLVGDYKYYDTFSKSVAGTYQGTTALVATSLFNPDFGWEVTKKLEAAVELGFIDSRITVEVNWYYNTSSNQLIEYQLPATTGAAGVFSNLDAATIQNTGLEAMLTTVNVSTDKVRWSTSMNVTFPKNKLASFRDIQNSSYNNYYKVGEPLSIQRRYIWEGVDPETGRHKFSDRNGNGEIDENDMVFMQPRIIKFYGGVLNTVQYGGFELSFLFQFTKRNANRLALSTSQLGAMENQPVQMLSYWNNTGDITDYPRPSQSPFGEEASDYTKSLLSSWNHVDASFIRLKTLTLSYQVPSKLLERIHLKGCTVFLQGQNLLTFTRYKNLDPETESEFPPLRMLTLGLNIKI